MKLFHKLIQIRARKQQEGHAQNPASQHEISQQNCANNFYQSWIEWKENHVSQSVVGVQMISIVHNIQIPKSIPTIVHINQPRIFGHWKTFRRDPGVRRVWRQIETIERHKPKQIHNEQPNQNDKQNSFHNYLISKKGAQLTI